MLILTQPYRKPYMRTENKQPIVQSIFFVRVPAGVTVTARAFFEVSNTFFEVFRTNSVGLMLVASIASVAGELVLGVAHRASRIVIAIEDEELVMVEGCWLPPLRAMAPPAVAGDRAM